MNNLDLQNHLLDLAENDFLILTETRKLALRLRNRFRSRKRGAAAGGWKAPIIQTYAEWSAKFWEDLQPEFRPASDLTRWRLIDRILRDIPPPGPLERDIGLVMSVDESFDQCLRHGLDPGNGVPANRLVEWRRRLWPTFERELSANGLFHPASLAQRIQDAVVRRPSVVPPRIAGAGFEYVGYWDKVLFTKLSEVADTRLVKLPRPLRPKVRAHVYPDREQEIYGILEDITAASAHHPLSELAVVVFDPSAYSPLISRFMEDLFGPPLYGDQAAYNLFPDSPLTAQPLFHSALLPLDFAARGRSRVHLLGILRSPYYGSFSGLTEALSQWDRVWREKGIERGLDALMSVVPDSLKEVLPENGESFREALNSLPVENRMPGAEWGRRLRAIWEKLGFPVLAGDRDRMALQSLLNILDGFEAAFGQSEVNGIDFCGWLYAAAEKVYVQKTGYDDAGIQVIGGPEIRGLFFERVYAPGLVSGVLPRPAHSFPFLSPRERSRVPGGSPQSQFEFAGFIFGQVQAACSESVLSYPMMNADGQRNLPSPFWPGQAERKQASSIPWIDDMPAMQRARWVSEGLLGIGEASKRETDRRSCDSFPSSPGAESEGEPSADPDFHVDFIEFPDEISVSALGTLLMCPARFFFEQILRLEPLPEIERGIDPGLKGRKIHEILSIFGRRVLGAPDRGKMTLDEALELLRRSVADVFGARLHNPHVGVEVKRLVGDDDRPGLLVEWLRKEWSRLEEGGRWVAVESPFSGLEIAGCAVTIKGRPDRVDMHPEYGLTVWDYKTGRVPQAREIKEDFSQPQLPAYLLAIRKGLPKGIGEDRRRLCAGYIDLRSIRHLDHCVRIGDSDDVDGLLAQWEEKICDSLNRAAAGDMSRRRSTETCDVNCPFVRLCGREE